MLSWIPLMTDIDDYPCPNKVPYSFPVLRAGITQCSTYAVVSRLKLSPRYTITVSGGTFVHPDYPQVTLTVPQKAVETETRLPLELKVRYLLYYHLHQCVSKNVWWGRVIHNSRIGNAPMKEALMTSSLSRCKEQCLDLWEAVHLMYFNGSFKFLIFPR